jgi:DNA-binding PadR family transcriptional regulator
MDDLTGFQRDLLVVAAGLDEPNGLDIKDDLETYYTVDINHGRLYPNLDTLVEKGLLEKAKADERTNRYLLTDRGERELRSRREWEDQYLGGSVDDADDDDDEHAVLAD